MLGQLERPLVAKGLNVSELQGPAAYTWFPWLPEVTFLGSEAGAVVQGLGQGGGGWAASPPLQVPAWVTGSRKATASSAGQMWPRRGRPGECPSASQLAFLPYLFLPKRQGRDWGTVSCQKVKEVEGQQDRGQSHHPRPLSPGQLAPSGHSGPSVLSQAPGAEVWAILTSLLGWAAG